jgi:anti-sigma B factor antagonist
VSATPELNDFGVEIFARDGGTALVQVKGEVDSYTAPMLEQRLTELVDGGVCEIVLDVADLTFMDTTGLAALARTFKRLRSGQGRLSLRSPRPNVQKTLEITGLDKVLLEG